MSPIEQFLSELENHILRQEWAIELKKQQKSEKQYIEDLLIVLKQSKIGFVTELFSSNEEKQKEFQEILKKIISNDREYHRILDELRNLFFLKKAHLLTTPEVAPQKEKAETAIDTIIQKAEEYIQKLDNQNEEISLEDLYQEMEQLFDLAIKFEDEELTGEIEDIDFFEKVLEEMKLSSKAKLDVVSYIFRRSVELAAKKPTKKRPNSYYELEDFYGENQIESTEELLEEMLSETYEEERSVLRR